MRLYEESGIVDKINLSAFYVACITIRSGTASADEYFDKPVTYIIRYFAGVLDSFKSEVDLL